MTTWRKLIKSVADGDEIIFNTLSEEDLDTEFDNGFGGVEGLPSTAWSERYVYFPICYDGAEWVGRAPRNTCEEVTHHVGGG